jgi:hypothetical protein
LRMHFRSPIWRLEIWAGGEHWGVEDEVIRERW